MRIISSKNVKFKYTFIIHPNLTSSGIYVCPINCLQIGRPFWQKNHYVKLVKVCHSSMVSALTSSQQPWGQFWGVPQGSILIPPVFQAKAGMYQGQPYSVSSPPEWNSFPADSFITTYTLLTWHCWDLSMENSPTLLYTFINKPKCTAGDALLIVTFLFPRLIHVKLQEGQLVVCQFQFLRWSAYRDVPDSKKAFLNLLASVQKWQRECGEGRTVVHCLWVVLWHMLHTN